MEQSKKLSVVENPVVDFDAICQALRTALEPARAHAISLHDADGEVLWLSESSMGPDEHNAVRDALEVFAEPTAAPVVASDLGDSRSAVLLRAVNSRRAMVGIIMLVVDTRIIKQDGSGAIRLMTPKLQRALTDYAEMRDHTGPAPARAEPPRMATTDPTAARTPTGSAAPATAAAAPTAAPFELTLADTMRIPRVTAVPSEVPAPAAVTAPAAPASPASPAAPSAVAAAPAPARAAAVSVATGAAATGSAAKGATPPALPPIERLRAALRRTPIALHVQRLVPLTKGNQMKRYEVLLRSKSEDAPNVAPQAMLKAAVENGLGSMIDRRVVTELVDWLVQHPHVWQDQPVMFSVNLTTTALEDEHFIKFLGLCLEKAALPKSMIAFEIDVPTAVRLRDSIGNVAEALHRLACPIVLDDFGLRTECFDLLRLPAVRYVKLAPQITTKMRTDKISQAAITAVVQMARVLGMHTVAKRTETTAEQEWLTALGVDFIQSNAFSPSAPLDSLAKTQQPGC
jgi:EAL domain-containing protein (putative c-di-GMP-specific phosphodiesterase class I)